MIVQMKIVINQNISNWSHYYQNINYDFSLDKLIIDCLLIVVF